MEGTTIQTAQNTCFILHIDHVRVGTPRYREQGAHCPQPETEHLIFTLQRSTWNFHNFFVFFVS